MNWNNYRNETLSRSLDLLEEFSILGRLSSKYSGGPLRHISEFATSKGLSIFLLFKSAGRDEDDKWAK